MNKIYSDSLDAELLDIREASDGTGGKFIVLRGGSRIRSTHIFMESFQDFGGLIGGHIEEAAPDFGRWESTGRKAGDDTEIVTTTFEGAP